MAWIVATLRRVANAPVIGRILRLPLTLMPRDRAVPILRGKLRGRRWVVGSSFQSCWLGMYEYEKQAVFSRVVKPGDVVFDVGANVGFYTLLASVLAGPRGKVFAFEPLPRNLGLLKRHVAINHLSNVTVFDGAVSDRTGTARFNADALPEMTRLSDLGGLEVQTFRLDDLLSSGRVAAPDLMKIDVEGAEADVLNGGRGLIESHRPTILLATHGPEVHRRCCDFLAALGYHLRPLDGKPLDRSSELLAEAGGRRVATAAGAQGTGPPPPHQQG